MKVGIGHSSIDNSRDAAREAVIQAISSSGKPALTFLFTTEFYNQREVFKEVKKLVGTSRITGFCAGGIITKDGVLEKGIGIATLSGEEIFTATSLQKGLRKDPEKVGKLAGKELLSYGEKSGTIFVFPDGFVPDVLKMIRGLYNTVGPNFNIIGGASGDNLRFYKTYQFSERGVEDDSISAVLLSRTPVSFAIGHGWEALGEILVITKAKGKRVFEINGVQAIKAYKELFGEISEEEFPKLAMKYPLGFSDIHGNFIIRDPLRVNSDGSIDFVTKVPADAVGYIMNADFQNLIETAKNVAEEAIRKNKNPGLVLVFDCVSRYLLMGKDFQLELNAIREAIGNVPMIGALTFGEIGSIGGGPMFHNKTTLIVTIGSYET